MSELFGDFKKVSKVSNTTFDTLLDYEEAYMKILKKYQNEIEHIESMLENVRAEREDFYTKKLNEIKHSMEADDVDPSIQQEWMIEIQKNMEKSFELSESLIKHYVVKNLEEFEQEFKECRNK